MGEEESKLNLTLAVFPTRAREEGDAELPSSLQQGVHHTIPTLSTSFTSCQR